MIEILITNVKTEISSNKILQHLENEYPHLLFNFDLEDFNKPYPCGHSILRVEGDFINLGKIISELKNSGFKCEIFHDKICV